MTRILFHLKEGSPDPWVAGLKAADPTLDIRVHPDWGSPDDGPAYAYVWKAPPGLLKQYPNIEAIFSLGAGVDHLTCDPDLPDVPIVRMSDDSLKQSMSEYLLMATLMMHRRMPQALAQQQQNSWERFFSTPPEDVVVSIMGYGALGAEAVNRLHPIGYQVRAWSRGPKPAEDQVTHFAGEDSLDDFLTGTDILIGLLPETPETRGLLNRDRLSKINQFGAVINAGRGGLVVLEDVIDLLNEGFLGGAMLDVFDTEPLQPDHPAWSTDRLIVTPHVAAITRPDSAGAYVVDMIKRLKNNQEISTLLDRNSGY